MGVEVDEARQRNQSVGHNDGADASARGRNLSDHAIVDDQVNGILTVGTHPLDDDRGHWLNSFAPPSNRYSTAIRTLTPLATCSTMTACALSATSAEISMPRFIGPGCITIA